MSDPTPNLAAALIAFQGEMPVVAKSQTAVVPTKSGGQYKYTYAGLPDVMAAVTPLLVKHGLAFSCCPRRTDDGSYELAGVLIHDSGESITGVLPLFGRTAQEIGSAITYARRYLLGSMTGVVTDDDDDGHLAQQAKARVQQTTADKPLTPRTQAALFALMGEFSELADADAQRQFLSDTLRRPVDSRKSLSEADGVLAGRRLRAWKDGIESAARTPPEVTAEDAFPEDGAQ